MGLKEGVWDWGGAGRVLKRGFGTGRCRAGLKEMVLTSSTARKNCLAASICWCLEDRRASNEPHVLLSPPSARVSTFSRTPDTCEREVYLLSQSSWSFNEEKPREIRKIIKDDDYQSKIQKIYIVFSQSS